MSTKINFDVDIDFGDRDKVLADLRHVSATISRPDGLEKHNTGVYFQDIPCDPSRNTANIDHKKAPEFGFFKIDCLNVSIYEDVRDEEHLVNLMREPMWELLEYKEVVEELFHIRDYYDLVKEMKPTTVEQLAMTLAIIRPSKRHLQYKDWPEVEKEVWDTPADDSYHFKRAHAISYAMAVVVQLNLLSESASQLS